MKILDAFGCHYRMIITHFPNLEKSNRIVICGLWGILYSTNI